MCQRLQTLNVRMINEAVTNKWTLYGINLDGKTCRDEFWY